MMMRVLLKATRVALLLVALLAVVVLVKADDITVNSVSECNNFDGILKITAISASNVNYGETATAYVTISSTQDLSSSTIYAEVDKLSQKVYPSGSKREAIQLCNYFSTYSSNGATCPESTEGEEVTSNQISFKVPSVDVPVGGSGTITLKAFASESDSNPILCAVINGSFTKNISPVVYMAQAPTAVKATAGVIGAAFLAIVALVVAKAVTAHKAKTATGNSAADPLGYQTASSDGVQA